MQPYINPNYYNQYQMPMYQPQQNLLPTQMSVTPNNGIRQYNNQNEIAVNEIPMDGSYKLFAKADMSEVVAKAWMPNGNIQTLEYSLKQPLENDKAEELPQIDLSLQFEPIMAEIKALSDKVDRMCKTRNRKEVNENES